MPNIGDHLFNTVRPKTVTKLGILKIDFCVEILYNNILHSDCIAEGKLYVKYFLYIQSKIIIPSVLILNNLQAYSELQEYTK